MKLLIVSVFLYMTCAFAHAQKIVYAEPSHAQLHDRNRLEIEKYEIIGKFKSNILIYKGIHDRDVICVYDDNMKQIDQLNLDFSPSKVLNYNFIAYPDFCWMIFSYNENHSAYCVAVKLGADGKVIGQPIQLDVIESISTEKIKWYGIVNSEDKQKIMLLKGTNLNANEYLIKTVLFDNNLKPLHVSESTFPVNDQNDVLNEFALDNSGNLLFGKGVRSINSRNTYSNYCLVKKTATTDFFLTDTIKMDNVMFDDVKIRIDNFNKKYIITSFCYKGNKNLVNGIFRSVVDEDIAKKTDNTVIAIDDIYRGKSKYEKEVRSKINNYYLQNIVLKKNGGFLICAENIFHGAYSNNVRWMDNNANFLTSIISLRLRSNANNIILLSFDKDCNLEWDNIISKTQFADPADGGDAIVSYQLINTGDKVCFLYNDLASHPPLLTYQVLASDGSLEIAPTLRGINKKYLFEPRFAKQINHEETVIPCLYHNFLTFAKVLL